MFMIMMMMTMMIMMMMMMMMTMMMANSVEYGICTCCGFFSFAFAAVFGE